MEQKYFGEQTYVEPKSIKRQYHDWYSHKVLIEALNNPPKPKSLLELTIPGHYAWNVMIHNKFMNQRVSFPLRISKVPDFTPFEQPVPRIANRNLRNVDDISRYASANRPNIDVDYRSQYVEVKIANYVIKDMVANFYEIREELDYLNFEPKTREANEGSGWRSG